MKTADKNYMDANDYASLINSGGNAASNIIHQLKWDGKEAAVTNNYTTVNNEKDSAGPKTSTIIIVVAVLIVAVVGVVLFTRK